MGLLDIVGGEIAVGNRSGETTPFALSAYGLWEGVGVGECGSKDLRDRFYI